MARTIMVVDDSRSLRQVVSIALRSAGFDVLEAQDGTDAIARLDGRSIDLLICDVHMPSLDGYAVVRAMRALPGYSHAPAIMLTTDDGDAAREAGRAAGADAWMLKPFRPSQMLEVVQRLLPI